MLSKRTTILTFIATFIVACMAQAFSDVQALSDNGVVSASRFRFTRTQARDPACGLLSPGAENLAFFMDGEPVCGTGCINATKQEGESMFLAFSKEVAFNGYSFRLPAEGAPGCDAVGWTAGAWTPQSDWQGVIENVFNARDRVMPSERRSEVYVELRPPRGLIICDQWGYIIISVLATMVPLCSWRGLEVEGVQLSRVFFALIPLSAIIVNSIMVGYFADMPSEMLQLELELGMCVIFFFNLVLQSFYWFQIWALNGTIFLVVGVYLGLEFQAWVIFSVGVLKLNLVVQVLVHRYWTGVNCRKMIESCHMAHERAWQDSFERNKPALLDLRKIACAIQVSTQVGPVRQYNSQCLAGLQHDKDMSGDRIHNMCGMQPNAPMRFLCKGTQIDRTSPATSFSHLYLQASAMHPLLIEKVCEWAGRSAGCFKLSRFGSAWVRGGEEFVEWRKVKAGQIPGSCVQFAKIKHPDRAIEKMYRVYKGDASFLADLARQAIVFERVEDMVTCLEEISKDKGVEVERIKNRMDPAYDSNLSAGYRDVLLNVRIVTARAKHMMLDTHVCEVQLLLSSVAKLKSDEGHRVYKAWRDLRGE